MKSTPKFDNSSANIIARDLHCVSRKNISDSALKVLYRLNKAGYEAYLVGGGVRDLLLSKHPKDFDVATSALPEQAAEQFKNSRLIGRRFKLLHVRFGKEIIEVATFRGHHGGESNGGESNGGENNGEENRDTDNNDVAEDSWELADADDRDSDGNVVDDARHNQDGHIQDGMIVRDNVYGTLTEDAWRRDFTVNALYYNVKDFTVLDYTGGMQDLNNRVLRVIGDATQRYQEDPVRMIRAVRLAVKLDFSLSPETAAPIKGLAHKLSAVPAARLFEEVLKLFLSGNAVMTFRMLREYGLFAMLFPQTDKYLDKNDPDALHFIEQGLRNTDARIEQDKPVTPAFLFAIMLWQPVQSQSNTLASKNGNYAHALQIAANDVISRQITTVSLPRRYSVQVREIWAMQSKLERRQGKRAFRLLTQPRFRAGYDFLLLRAQSGESDLQPLCDWWTEFQERSGTAQADMVRELSGGGSGKKRRRRRSRSRNKTT